jgi:hypothetical protein
MQLGPESEDAIINDIARYLYRSAGNADGQRRDTYMDAADALMDVLGMWADDEAARETA